MQVRQLGVAEATGPDEGRRIRLEVLIDGEELEQLNVAFMTADGEDLALSRNPGLLANLLEATLRGRLFDLFQQGRRRQASLSMARRGDVAINCDPDGDLARASRA